MDLKRLMKSPSQVSPTENGHSGMPVADMVTLTKHGTAADGETAVRTTEDQQGSSNEKQPVKKHILPPLISLPKDDSGQNDDIVTTGSQQGEKDMDNETKMNPGNKKEENGKYGAKPENKADKDEYAVVSTKNWTVTPATKRPNGTLGKTEGAKKWLKVKNTFRAASIANVQKRERRKTERQDSFLAKFSTRQTAEQIQESGTDSEDDDENVDTKPTKKKKSKPLDPARYVLSRESSVMFYWLGVVTVAVLYNVWTLIAREAFPEIQEDLNHLWFTLDYLMDSIYVADIILQLRTGYLEQGILVYDWKKLAKYYATSKYFVFDLVSLLPLDLLQIWLGIHPLLRCPRFLKAYRALQFSYLVESRTPVPNLIRVANLTHVLFVGCHWFAGFFFMISKSQNFLGEWTYTPNPEGNNTVTRMYLHSLHWATLTLTAIGDLPPPETNEQFIFTIASYLIGIFVFATVVGQVGNVITNRNAARLEFERLLDGAKSYMQNHDVPKDVQTRVQRWYDYTWSRGRMAGQGGGDINSLGLLPDKLKAELALHVNLDTLKKVSIFQECEPEFLHELVLKMKVYIFTPGDLVCRCGEVAREMFIIADGVLEVLSQTGDVIVTLSSGGFFGEIGILNLEGVVNRRTADVKSVGYSELICLAREDVLSALKDYPHAETILTQKAQERLQQIKKLKADQDALKSDNIPEATPISCKDMLGRPTSPHSSRGSCKSISENERTNDVKIDIGPGGDSPRELLQTRNVAERTLSAMSMIDGLDKPITLPPVRIPTFGKSLSNPPWSSMEERLRKVEKVMSTTVLEMSNKLDDLYESNRIWQTKLEEESTRRENENKEVKRMLQQLVKQTEKQAKKTHASPRRQKAESPTVSDEFKSKQKQNEQTLETNSEKMFLKVDSSPQKQHQSPTQKTEKQTTRLLVSNVEANSSKSDDETCDKSDAIE